MITLIQRENYHNLIEYEEGTFTAIEAGMVKSDTS